nr:unnamed protein product [Callosobruchus analis]
MGLVVSSLMQPTLQEIHVGESWDFSLSGSIPKDLVSLLMVMVHEIGHVLRLGHSNVKSVIMYIWYQDKIRGLDIDDKNAIFQLYGHHLNPSKPAAKPTDTTPVTKPAAPESHNHRLYISHNSFLWKLDLNNLLIPELPDKLDNDVPAGIDPSSISHIFQNSAGDLIAIDKKNHKYYITSFPGLNIKRSFKYLLMLKLTVFFKRILDQLVYFFIVTHIFRLSNILNN